MKTRIVTAFAAAALVSTGYLLREAVGFREKPLETRTPEPPSVSVAVVKSAPFNPATEHVGHAEAVQATDILPQIDGYILRVCFAEGAKVEKGDLLFEIDPEQYLAAKNLRSSEVASAEARVIVAQAEVDRAERYYTRLATADERGVKATERDTAETSLASAKAALNAANAAVGQAKAASAIADFNLRHTKVHAPISGRIGRTFRHVGDYVSPSKSSLARIVMTDPMRVVFPVSDKDWMKMTSNSGSRRLRLVLPDGSIYGHEGEIEFGDNEMNSATATIAIRASFPNPEGLLVANEFVRVLSDAKEAPSVLVVPTSALVRSDGGLQAWKVGEDSVAHPVEVETDGEWNGLSRVKSGLSEGDVIVLDGAFKLRDGDKVKVVEK